MNSVVFLFFSLVLGSTILSKEHVRTIKLNDLDHENAYIPVRLGEEFIIEIDADDPVKSGWFWAIDGLQLDTSHEEGDLLQCTNLNENQAGDFYKRIGEVKGMYHFNFKVNEKRIGSETVTFIHRKKETMEGHKSYPLHISISDPNKIDL